jgi:serine protease Do
VRDLTVASFGDSDAIEKGTVVLAAGNPSGYNFFGSVTMGIISGKNRYFDTNNDGVRDMFVSYLQHDAAINSGNSGGPLYNIHGTVIGINVSKFVGSEIEGMGFAIPIETVTAILDDLEAGLRT